VGREWPAAIIGLLRLGNASRLSSAPIACQVTGRGNPAVNLFQQRCRIADRRSGALKASSLQSSLYLIVHDEAPMSLSNGVLRPGAR
jgi:hypothetical protein